MGNRNTEVEKKHVAVLAFPFGSHAAPLFNLVRGIAAAAPGVRFSFFSTAASNRSIFSDTTNQMNNIKPYGVPDGNTVLTKNLDERLELFLKATPGNFRSVMEVAMSETGRKISCIISDAFLAFAGKMAEDMDVPWVPFWTAGPRSLLVHIETEAIRQILGANDSEDQRTLDFIPGFSSVRVADLPQGVLSGNLESPFSKMLHGMGLMLGEATAVVINSFEELDPIAVNELKSRLQKFLNVGPFTLTWAPPLSSDEHGCLQWLDEHKTESVAYIGFGRVVTPPPHELAALAEALETSGFPFLWSFRGNVDEELPKGFIERTSSRGKVVPWAPQMDVLGHRSVGVFVTHCGWNSVLESIVSRVPMICRPFFGDQMLNMRVVESVWGIGLGIEGTVFTKDGAVKALEQTLLNEQGKKMREKAEAFRETALKAVGINGDSSENLKTLIELVTN
ncbi:hypothetical protein I3843_07G185700 [Carya illinoinensis]|nr:hypothetical protein I3760_07G186800 [Carya illinoinensis]KAG7972472.1 hypothetical protein I3843_07G185700 [Carya illinoinensis]